MNRILVFINYHSQKNKPFEKVGFVVREKNTKEGTLDFISLLKVEQLIFPEFKDLL